MKQKRYTSVFATLAFVAAAMLTLQGCNTTDSGDDYDEHSDAYGFVIEQNNAEIVRFENNKFIWNPSETWADYFREGIEGIVISPDVIDLTEENPRGMTPSVTIRWIDHDGDVFDLPDLFEEEGGEYWLDWEWRNNLPNVLTEECTAEAREDVGALDEIRPFNFEQHGSDGQWGFHFRADHAGEADVRFRLMHGHGAGEHPDFASGWMTVVVADDDHNLIDENGIYLHERDKCRTR